MDGNMGGAPPIGFDHQCLNPDSAVTNSKKDYIAIPFAEVIDFSTSTRYFFTNINASSDFELYS